jgi:hypothetical protein
MDRIFEVWRRVYFTEPIFLNILLVTLIIALVKRRAIPSLRWIPLYISLFLLFFLVDYAYTIFVFPADEEGFQKVQRQINFFITVLELLVFISFFYSQIHIRILRKTLDLLLMVSLAAVAFIYLETHLNHGFITFTQLNRVYIIELATLFFVSLCYFIQLFRETPVENLRDLPGFWIATGLSFYSLCTLPITIANSYFFYQARGMVYTNLFSIIYIFYILLFILITRSFLCRQPGMM